MNHTPAQAVFFAARVELAKAQIILDIESGRVDASVANFGDLHDHVDANEYGDCCDDGPEGWAAWNEAFPDAEGAPDYGTLSSQNAMEAMNQMQGAVDEWLRAGRPVEANRKAA